MMDLRNLCSKVDVDAIRAKIPPMPQIKLPKSMIKLKSRKIFCSKEFSFNSRRDLSKRTATDKIENKEIAQGQPYNIPPSEFIDRTPTRISTISSLMNRKSGGADDVAKGTKMWQPQNNDNDDDDNDNENSYRNAGGIDDYYPSPLNQPSRQRLSRPLSPLKATHVTHESKAQSEQNIKMSFGEKFQKSYKDLTEFKLKHIFAKKTVVHADKIDITNYIESFDEDRIRENRLQQKRDRDIADNYNFKFKEFQQKSEESFLDTDSLDSSPEHTPPKINHKQLSELSGDESGMESSPPKRTPGIASTRFSRVRHSPLNMSVEDDYNNNGVDEDIEINRREVGQSTTKKSFHNKTQQNPKSLEEVIDYDDDDDYNNVQFKTKPNQMLNRNMDSRGKSVKGIASAAFSRDRNEPRNKTLEEDLDIDDGNIELNNDNKQFIQNNNKQIFNSQQKLQRSVKGIGSTAFSSDRHGAFNKTLEEDLDVDDGDIELNEMEVVESPKTKPANKNHQQSLIEMRQNPRRKSAKGIIASAEFSKTKQTPVNKTLEEDIDIDDGGGLEFNDLESPKIKQTKISFEKSIESQQTHQNISQEESTDDDIHENIELNVIEEINSPKIPPNSSSLYDIKKQKTSENLRKSKSIKERMSRLTKSKLEDDETNKEVSEKRRKSAQSPEDNDAAAQSSKPFDAIKHNFKRIHKSIKLPQHQTIAPGTGAETDDTCGENTTKQTKTQQLTEHLKRFRSNENVDKTSEEGENNKSPKHNITNKIQEWKKSIRKKVDPHNVDNEEDYGTTSPQKSGKPVGSLMRKLKHIRSRKNESDDPDEDEEGGETYKESLAARAKLQFEKGAVVASQVPQKTMKKLSETKKFFKKKQENDGKKKTNITQTDDEELDEENGAAEKSPKQVAISIPTRPPPPIPRPYFNDPSSEEEDNDNQKFITKSIAESQLIALPAARAVWTTQPILLDETMDYEEDLPRVVLHQDNSNVFEPTLIISVTRPMPCVNSPIITELSPDSAEESTSDTKPDNWIPNQDQVATFLEMTPPLQRKFCEDTNCRANSIDSSSDDSWFKDIPKGPSTAVINRSSENEEPWKIQKGKTDDNLYKTKSIDLFEMQKKHGGVFSAFEDFDDELKNTPVVKVEVEKTDVVEMEADDCEEFKDFDEVSHNITLGKIEEPSPDDTELDDFKDFEDEFQTNAVNKLNENIKTESGFLVPEDTEITPVNEMELENIPILEIKEKITPVDDTENINILNTEICPLLTEKNISVDAKEIVNILNCILETDNYPISKTEKKTTSVVVELENKISTNSKIVQKNITPVNQVELDFVKIEEKTAAVDNKDEQSTTTNILQLENDPLLKKEINAVDMRETEKNNFKCNSEIENYSIAKSEKTSVDVKMGSDIAVRSEKVINCADVELENKTSTNSKIETELSVSVYEQNGITIINQTENDYIKIGEKITNADNNEKDNTTANNLQTENDPLLKKGINAVDRRATEKNTLTDFKIKEDITLAKIENKDLKSLEKRESSEELENPDDDNSSRITQIYIHPQEPKKNETTKMEQKLKSPLYGNSQESLTDYLDNKDAIDSGEEDDNEESDEEPPSKSPSPPPCTSTPPPLPQRKPSLGLLPVAQSSLELASSSLPPPPLPQKSKAPIPPTKPPPVPPKIPDRNPPTGISKPLVKTGSLRLAYSEQVNPKDIGKVNKLISRFETDAPKLRPRVTPRKPFITKESDESSDEDYLIQLLPNKLKDITPTNHPKIQKSISKDSVDSLENIPTPNVEIPKKSYNKSTPIEILENNKNTSKVIVEIKPTPTDNTADNNDNNTTLISKIDTSLSTREATSKIITDNSESTTTLQRLAINSNTTDVNSNFSQPNSVYGSPLEYPSSLIGSAEVTPLANRKEIEPQETRRNHRGTAPDDDFFSTFDSDEENSYYSLSSTNGNRNVVDL